MFRKTARFLLSPFRWVIRFGLGGRTRGEKLLRRGWLSVIALLTVGVPLAWLVLFAQYRLAQPSSDFHWVRKTNVEVSRIPEGERAWPIYGQALSELVVQAGTLKVPAVKLSRTMYTDASGTFIHFESDRDLDCFNSLLKSKFRASLQQFANDNRETLDLILKGTRRRHVGYIFDESLETQLDKSGSWVVWPRPLCDFQIQVIRESLRKALYAAVAGRDAGRVLECAKAMLRLCAHYSQLGPFDFARKGANRGLETLAKDVSFVVQEWPDLLSDSDLDQLAVMFGGAGGFQTDDTAYMDWIENILDQCYSEDGEFTAQGVTILASCINPYIGNDSQPRHTVWLHPLTRVGKVQSVFVLPVAVRWLPARAVLKAELMEANEARLRLYVLSLRVAEEQTRELTFGRLTTKPDWVELPQALLTRAFAYRWSTESVQMRLESAVIAIRLEQFRRANTQWPVDLTLLGTVVPTDRFADQPIRYEIRDGRPYVWSIGADFNDNGGMLHPENRSGFDWQLLPIEDFDVDKHLGQSGQRQL